MRKVLPGLVGVGLLVLLIGGASFLPPARGCPAIRPPTRDSPPGWSWEQDVYNGCAYTLFNERGERAPAEIYSHLKLKPPKAMHLYAPRLLGIVAITISVTGLIALARRIRRPARTRNSAELDRDQRP